MNNKHWFYTTFYVIPLLLLLSTKTYAVTWDGNGSTSNWNDALNWDTNMIPTASDAVIIGAFTVNIPTGFTAMARNVTLTGATLNLASSGNLSINIGGNYALILDGASVFNNGNITIMDCIGGIQLSGTSLLQNNATLKILTYSGHGIRLEATACTFNNSGNIAIDNGTNAGSSGISNGFAQPTFTNSGTITIGNLGNVGSGITPTFGGSYTNSGTINIINTGTGKPGLGSGFAPPIWNNSATGIIILDAGIGGPIIGDFNLHLNNNGTVTINKLSTAVNMIFTGTGIFTGSQKVSISNEVSAGNSAGCLTFNKGLDIVNGSPTSKVRAELGGTAACTQYDKISVIGNATVDGNLIVSLINGFIPSGGQSFTLLEATSLSGTFSNVNFPTVNGISWAIMYTSTSVIVSTTTVLPVELINFTVDLGKKNTAKLRWKTASEINNKGFFIEKSTNARSWSTIDFVKGFGTTTAEQNYFLEDKNVYTGINYYRLKQMDFDGHFDYSEIKNIKVLEARNQKDITLFPNPAKDRVQIQGFYSPTAKIQLFNEMGKLVLDENLTKSNQLNIAHLPVGLYLIRVSDEHKSLTGKLIKYE